MTFLIALIALFLQSGTPPGKVQVATAVLPETTTVGQHFVATIRVRVPAGTEVRFPGQPDSSAQVDSAGAAVRRDSTVGAFTESTMNYVLAAWDTGTQRVGLDSVTVITDGEQRTAALKGFSVYVRSVLPLDTALRKPKPFRPVVAAPVFNWLPWLIAGVIAILAVVAIYAWRAWRRRIVRGLTPFQLAQRDFANIESQRLIEAGESERYVVEMTAVLRVYLASVVPVAVQSATTHELAANLTSTSVIPVERLIGVLDETDMIKFARERSSAERAGEIGTEARKIVAETDAALDAAATAMAKAA